MTEQNPPVQHAGQNAAPPDSAPPAQPQAAPQVPPQQSTTSAQNQGQPSQTSAQPAAQPSSPLPPAPPIDLRQRRLVSSLSPAPEVVVAGYVQDVRNLGGIAFIQLRDESGVLQVTLLKKQIGKERFKPITEIPRESVVAMRGLLQESKEAPGGMELLPSAVEVLSTATAPLPLGVIDKVNVEFDTRFNHRFMDLRKPEVGALFSLKSVMLQGIRSYLISQGLTEVQTPKIVAQGAEGGSTLFPIDYFGRRAYLAQSPQLYKQMLMSCNFGGIFEIAPAFRAEESDTIRHVTEFQSLDVEIPYIDGPERVFDNAEGVVIAAHRAIQEHGQRELKVLGRELPVLKAPFPRIPFRQVREMLTDAGKRMGPDDDLDTEGEKMLGDMMAERGQPAYFITDFPSAIKKSTFYAMRREEDPTLTTYADLDLLGQEIMSGGQREHRLGILEKQIGEAGLESKNFEFYLEPFRFGMPPHGGYGLGVERLLQKLLGLPNIREAILFPRDMYRLTP